MDIKKLKSTNLELTEAIENYVREKIGMLEKFLKNIELPQSARIEIGKTSEHHKKGKIFFAEVNLELPHRLLRATVDAEDLYEAIDRVKEELEREIIKYTGGAKSTRLKSQRKSKDFIHLAR